MCLFKPFAALGLILVLAGCGSDPYIHGPFLIGAEPPGYYPENCRPGDVRSHSAQNGWDACMAEGAQAYPSTAVLSPLPPPPRTAGPRPTGSGRSAWN